MIDVKTYREFLRCMSIIERYDCELDIKLNRFYIRFITNRYPNYPKDHQCGPFNSLEECVAYIWVRAAEIEYQGLNND